MLLTCSLGDAEAAAAALQCSDLPSSRGTLAGTAGVGWWHREDLRCHCFHVSWVVVAQSRPWESGAIFCPCLAPPAKHGKEQHKVLSLSLWLYWE